MRTEPLSTLKRMTNFVVCLTVGLSLLLSSPSASAIPTNPENYNIILGGLADIQDGAYVEGSVRQGGIQPDYFIDLSKPPLSSILEKARLIGLEKISYWDKVGLVVELVRRDFFKYTDYSNPYYRRLLKKYRDLQQDIPLHEYGVCMAGVCREHALILHFALKAAGIPNWHAYASIHRASNWEQYSIYEDHAFTVVRNRQVDWVVDAYYWGFNGFRLEDLLSPEGITEKSPYAPIASPGPGTRKILKLNDFPKIYNPKIVNSCSHLFR